MKAVHTSYLCGKDQATIDAYREHPDRIIVAARIERMEDKGVGVGFQAVSRFAGRILEM